MILLNSASMEHYDRHMLQANVGIAFTQDWYNVPKHRWYTHFDREYRHPMEHLTSFVENNKTTFDQKLVITVFTPLDTWLHVNSPVYKLADIVLLYDRGYTVVRNDINPLNERRRYDSNVMEILVEDYIARKEWL